MSTCSNADLLQDSRCFGCLDDGQIRVIIASLLCKILKEYNPMASCDAQTLLNDGRCFECFNDNQLLVIQAQLLCEIKNAEVEVVVRAVCFVGLLIQLIHLLWDVLSTIGRTME